MLKPSLAVLKHPLFLMSLFALSLGGCATGGNHTSPGTTISTADARDPLESINRKVFRINQKLDRKILKPLAQTYKNHVPDSAQTCIANVFSNLGEISTTANQLLQGHPGDATSDASRFAVNSTVGFLGCFDPATTIGLDKHKKDFGGTLAIWGVSDGPFLVLPLLGASDLRDSAGMIPASFLNPTSRIKNIPSKMAVDAGSVVSSRAAALGPNPASLPADPYQAYRDAFFVKRSKQIFDTDPPTSSALHAN